MMYDAVIVGSGLGGLLCGTILSKEGYRVCVIEKNPKPGGCLQSMRRKGCIFNTGIHYMGGLDEGRVLRQYFKYFGLDGKINIRRLDETGFDIIGFDDGKEYPLASKARFVDRLSEYFPNERAGLRQYTEKIEEVCRSLPFYALDGALHGAVLEKPYLGISAEKFVHALIRDTRLRQVLFGNDLMYGSISDKTSLMLYSLVNGSFMDGAWRMAGDSEQITEVLTENIHQSGGTVLCNNAAERFVFEGNNVRSVLLHNGEEVEGTHFISDLHPQVTLNMIENGRLKKSYRNRMEHLQNTPGFFVLHVVLKERSFPYFNYNYYHCGGDNASFRKFMMIPAGEERDAGYARAFTILTRMDYSEVKRWEHTTVERRGADYAEFKARRAEELIIAIDRKFPGFREAVIGRYASTPLSYRDYTGTPEGSAYGVLKDCNHPMSTMVFPGTGIPNLLLTGQSVYFHGMLGVSIGAVATCSELLGTNYLINKIRG